MSTKKKKNEKIPDGPFKMLFANTSGFEKMSEGEKLKKLFNIEPHGFEPKIQSEEPEINFKKLLEEHKKRTENNMPFTLQQVEDIIFVSDRKLISLEYIFYQQQGNYHEIDKPYDYYHQKQVSYEEMTKHHELGLYSYIHNKSKKTKQKD